MPKLFKLDQEVYSEIDQEWQWTYLLLFNFKLNYQTITKITITDHYRRKKGRELITNELILEIVTKLNEEMVEPTDYSGKRKVFIEEIFHSNKPYLLIFWFKDSTTNHLWIRNCYPIN